MKGDFKMKKSSFIALVMGTVSGVLFALGMCMALLPEWDAFTEGVIFGAIGIVMSMITVLIWCKMEHKKLPKVNGKNVLRTIYAIVAALVLGVGMCMCLVWEQIIWGTLVGLLGIIMLIALIPMIKGIK
jgi:predicted neutral ceramidase superfamily lipid hydrolase